MKTLLNFLEKSVFIYFALILSACCGLSTVTVSSPASDIKAAVTRITQTTLIFAVKGEAFSLTATLKDDKRAPISREISWSSSKLTNNAYFVPVGFKVLVNSAALRDEKIRK